MSRVAKESRIYARTIIKMRLPWGYIHITTKLVSTPTEPQSRLTVVSREAKKKQHARASSGLRDHYSELFTRMAALKF